MTSWLWETFVDPLLLVHNQKALLGGCLAAVVCGVVGCFVILRRMAFLGDALSHAMLAGVVSGYLFMQLVFGREAHAPAMILGSIVAGLVTVGLIGFVSRVSRIKDDTAIGIMYTGIFAFGGLMASAFSQYIHLHIYDYIVGMLLAVGDSHLRMMAIVSAFVLAVVILCYRQLQITAFDPVMAASIGIPVVLMNYVLITCTSLVVVSAVMVVGIILVVGMLVTPAATAYLLCDRLNRMLVLAAMFGVTSVVGGIYLATWIGKIDPAPMIVLLSTLQFAVVLVIAPRYGILADWLRRRAMVPQPLVEDVLGCVLRAEGTAVPVRDVFQFVRTGEEEVRRALAWLESQELLRWEGDRIVLTEAGEREARRLVRAHRLWETYLEHVGTPAEELHAKAHEMEHVHDEAVVDYLDDKLGHPLRDPHGAEIPEDFVHLVPGTEVKASLLREGHKGVVTRVAAPAETQGLEVGMEIATGSRREAGKVWTFVLPDGREVALDHASADAVTVQLE